MQSNPSSPIGTSSSFLFRFAHHFMSFGSIVPQINENFNRRRMKASCFCWHSICIWNALLFYFSSASHMPLSFIHIRHMPRKNSIFPIFTRWINTSRFDFKSQHQQFVMRWAIISVHVISFNSAYNIPNSWRTHSHPYCCCLHAFFLVAVVLFSPFSAINRYRCVNTCFTVEHKIGYFNITMTTWCLQHSICSICHIFNR